MARGIEIYVNFHPILLFSQKILKLVFIFYNYFYIESFIYAAIGKPI